MASETVFSENLHYVPEASWPLSAFTVLRAGKVSAAAQYGVRRTQHVGQDVLFCVSGAGFVQSGARRFEVQASDLVWIANQTPHAHAANELAPWTLLWFRFDGPHAAALRARLFGDGVPRVKIGDGAGMAAWFERLFGALRRRERNLDFRLNQLLSEFFLIRRSCARRAGLAADEGSDQRRRRRGARRHRPLLVRRGHRRSRAPKPVADPAAVSETSQRAACAAG